MNAAPLCDLHSHLVPGVDDGAQSMDDTLEAVERMVGQLITKIVTTPHLDASLAQSPKAYLQRLADVDVAFEAARAAIAERFPEVEFLRGHEVMVDVPDPDFSDPRVRLAGGPYVLIEWPRLQLPPRTDFVIKHIIDSGYRPVIAHPERYIGMSTHMHLITEWKQAGALLQVNFGSLVGRYGKEAEAVAGALISGGFADVMSSDFHARSHLKLFAREIRGWFEEHGAGEQFDVLAGTNTRRLVAGDEPLPVSPVKVERGFWTRLRGMLKIG